MSSLRWRFAGLTSFALGASFALGCGGGTTAAQPSTTAQSINASDSGESPEAEHHRHAHHGGVLMLIGMSVHDLDLSTDQKGAVEKIKTDMLSKMEPARAAGKEFTNTLADGVAAGAIDRPKTDAAIEKLATASGSVHTAAADALNQLHATLNTQQRTTLVDKMQAHWEKWKEAHGKDEAHEDHHQHHPGALTGLIKQVGLTQDEVDKIHKNFKDEMKATPQTHEHKEVTDHMAAFAAAFKSDTFDAKKLNGNEASAHMAKWGATRMARLMEAAAPVLTPEQRTKLATILRDHADHHES